MPDRREDIRYELALASRMLANEGVLDAFGHVSLRHPGDPGRLSAVALALAATGRAGATCSNTPSTPSRCGRRPSGCSRSA